MSETLWIRSHVELLLQRHRDVCRVAVDDDGDFPFRYGTAAGWVMVVGTAPVMVEVVAHAATGLKRSAKLLSELNEVQRRSRSARVQLSGDAVLVLQTVHSHNLTLPVLAQAIDEVSQLADDIGPLLAAVFDGRTPYPASVLDEEEANGT